MIPKIGDTFSFIPTVYNVQYNGTLNTKERNEKNEVTGRVTMIHRRHGWYRVSYPTNSSGIQHECFKFYP